MSAYLSARPIPQNGSAHAAARRAPARKKAGRRQRGQAMVEAIVAAALVMVPLFLAIPIIAKYQDIRVHVVQGARYAAWERTVWFGGAAAAEMGLGDISANKWHANAKGDDAIRAEIGSRILAKNPNAFNTTSDQSPGSTALPGHDLWRDRRGNTLLQDYSNINGSYANDQAPGFINVILTPLLNVASMFSSFTVDTNAQYTATLGLAVRQVAFNTAPLAVQRDAMKGYPGDFLATGTTLNFSEKNVIVANSWNADGPGSYDQINSSDPAVKARISVYKQVRGLTPTSLLKPTSGIFKDMLSVLQAISLVLFPELSTLDLGRLEVDRVPADRLAP